MMHCSIYYHQTKARGVEYIKDMIINPVPGRKVPRELYDVMGTTIFALVLDYFDLKNITTASPYKHELDNAVMCDVNDDVRFRLMYSFNMRIFSSKK